MRDESSRPSLGRDAQATGRVQQGQRGEIVRIAHEDGSASEHEWNYGVYFPVGNGEKDVSDLKLAYMLGGQQVRYLTVVPKKNRPWPASIW